MSSLHSGSPITELRNVHEGDRAAGKVAPLPVRPPTGGAATIAAESIAEITAALVPAPLPRWRQWLGRIVHLWLLIAFLLTWEFASVYGRRNNPQLDVMLPPPTAVVSAAADLLHRHVLFTHIASHVNSGSSRPK